MGKKLIDYAMNGGVQGRFFELSDQRKEYYQVMGHSGNFKGQMKCVLLDICVYNEGKVFRYNEPLYNRKDDEELSKEKKESIPNDLIEKGEGLPKQKDGEWDWPF